MAPAPSWLSSLGRLVASSLGEMLRSRRPPRPDGRPGRSRPPAPRAPRAPSTTAGGRSAGPAEDSPGRFGRDATVEVDPQRIGAVRMQYHPDRDGDPDPGEIVWTWVPFEENDGRGKDRPVLVVAAEPNGTLLAVQLTSKDHGGEPDFVPVGSGAWDGEHRPSWANIDRVLRVHGTGMRREAAALDERHYARVELALRDRYGWR